MPVSHSLDDFQKAHSPPSILPSDPLVSPETPPEMSETHSPSLFTIVYSASQPNTVCNSCGTEAPVYWLEEEHFLCEDCKIW